MKAAIDRSEPVQLVHGSARELKVPVDVSDPPD